MPMQIIKMLNLYWLNCFIAMKLNLHSLVDSPQASDLITEY